MTTPPEGTQPPPGPGYDPSGYGTQPPVGAYGVPPQGGPHGADGGPDPRPTDVVSIVGLVLAFLLAPVGLVVSIIGLVRTAGGRRKGRGFAIAGVVVSVVLTLAAVAAVVGLVSVARYASEDGVTIEEYGRGAGSGSAVHALASHDR